MIDEIIEPAIDPVIDPDTIVINRTKDRLMQKLPENLKPLVPVGLTAAEQVEWLLLCEEAGLYAPKHNPDTIAPKSTRERPLKLSAMDRIKQGLTAGGFK